MTVIIVTIHVPQPIDSRNNIIVKNNIIEENQHRLENRQNLYRLRIFTQPKGVNPVCLGTSLFIDFDLTVGPCIQIVSVIIQSNLIVVLMARYSQKSRFIKIG